MLRDEEHARHDRYTRNVPGASFPRFLQPTNSRFKRELNAYFARVVRNGFWLCQVVGQTVDENYVSSPTVDQCLILALTPLTPPGGWGAGLVGCLV